MLAKLYYWGFVFNVGAAMATGAMGFYEDAFWVPVPIFALNSVLFVIGMDSLDANHGD